MYAKVFTQIYDSSIADDWQVRVVFEDLLVLSDSEGTVDMTPEAISARTRIPLQIISRALVVLQRPDAKSRTPDEDGRRIVLLDSHRTWGWRIVNYEKYRGMKCEFDRRSYMRKYMRAKRKGASKTNSLTESYKTLTSPSPSSYPSSQGNGGLGERGEGVEKIPWDWVLKWLNTVRDEGGDYTDSETKNAWLALKANGWMWGKNPVIDWRSALECKIQDNRGRKTGNSNGEKIDLTKEVGTREQSEARRKRELEEMK